MLTLDIKDLPLNIALWENLNSIIKFLLVNQLDEEFVYLFNLVYGSKISYIWLWTRQFLAIYEEWDKPNRNEHGILQMISEPLIYIVIKRKLDTELMQLHSYKATDSSTE